MSTRYYGANFGAQTTKDVTEASSSPTKDVEVAIVYTATANGKVRALEALSAIADYITKDTWPPA
jgi:hypothetical protein